MTESGGGVAFGEYEIDFERRELRRGGRPVDLPRTPLLVLLHLAEHRDRTVSKQELMDAIWPGVAVGDASLSRALAQVREAVQDDGDAQRVIRTQKGLGYRFVAEARPFSVQATAPSTGAERAVGQAPLPGRETRLRLLGLSAAALAALAVSSAAWYSLSHASGTAKPVRLTVAVLPFADLTGDVATERHAAGLTDEIIGALATEGGQQFEVVGRTASSATVIRGSELRRIGRGLGASHVIEGSVRTGDGRVRVSARLLSVERGTELWSGLYDRPVGDPRRIHDVIASQITQELMLWRWAEIVASGGSAPAEAELLRESALALGHMKAADSLLAAERALALNPELPVAHALIASTLAGSYGSDPERETAARKIEAHAREALRLAPNEAVAHEAASRVHAYLDRDWPAAEREARRSCELNVDWNPFSCLQLVRTLGLTGRGPEAIALARSVSAKFAGISFARHMLSALLLANGRSEEALRECERANALAGGTIDCCGMVLWALGRRDEAATSVRLAYEAQGYFTFARRIARLQTEEGPAAVWRAIATTTAPDDPYLPQGMRALYFAQLGDWNAAQTALERGLAAHELPEQIAYAAFDPIRDTPRFRAIVEKAGLTAYHARYLRPDLRTASVTTPAQ